MRVTHYYLATALLGLAAILSLGCDDSTGPTTGAIAVTVSTAGAKIDVPDGYTLSVDGGPGQLVGANAVVTIADLPAGNHLVRLDGLAPNCSVSGTNPSSVDVIAGDKAASPVSVFFSVSCIAKTLGAGPPCTLYGVFVVPSCSYEVSGLVSLRTPQGTRPLAQASVAVFGWVPIPDDADPSRLVSFQRGAHTDDNGRYTVKGFPNGVFSIVAGDDGYGKPFDYRYDQPCAVGLELTASTITADVELFSVDSPMPDATRSPPLLTGIVFEQGENGRRPLAGVKISLETLLSVEVRTTTDENGRYALCRVPRGALYAQKSGYELKNGEFNLVGLVNLAGLTEKQLDIEMKRSQ